MLDFLKRADGLILHIYSIIQFYHTIFNHRHNMLNIESN